MTITVQISNTDNRLTQTEWAEFVKSVRDALKSATEKIYFEGGAPWDSPRQDACWVAELEDKAIDTLKDEMTSIRKKYRQDSVALTQGETTFI